MALTDSTLSNGFLGPGSDVSVTISSGPIPVDDYCEWFVTDPVSGRQMLAGDADTRGLLICNGRLGIGTHRTTSYTSEAGLARGALINLFFRLRHANGSLVDSGSVLGTYMWDPTSALWVVVHALNVREFPQN